MSKLRSIVRVISIGLVASSGSLARADEGMFLLNNPPIAQLKSKYNFTPSAEWLARMQKSAVRFGTGGSGSIVSADGLVMTNHHVGSDMLLKLSTKEKNLLAAGFAAPTRDQELKCPDLEIDLLWEIVDVTDRVNADVKPDTPAAEAGAARRRAVASIEKESQDKTGLKSDVVTLYQGGRYHLYRYKSFVDVRLVFAPEEGIAFFGGDTDNFEFPRFNLDCCFFRLYENGKPYKSEHHLTWSAKGAAENDLVFVFGHPGRTSRLFTFDHTRFLRDVQVPAQLEALYRREIKLNVFAGRNAENARVSRDDVLGAQNSRKVYTGMLAGLQDPRLMAKKEADEQKLLELAATKPDLATTVPDAIRKIADAQEHFATFFTTNQLLTRQVLRSQLLGHALRIVRHAAERPKDNADRLTEFTDSNLESLYLNLYSPEPISEELEIERLADSLALLAEQMGADSELVATMLDGLPPRERARIAVRGTTLKDPAARKALIDGGSAALASTNDPMLKLAAALDGPSREVRKQWEDEVQAVERSNYATLANARFSLYGDSSYPDATFTLRMSFGTVKGLAQDNTPAFTTFAGLYARAAERAGQESFGLPPRWIDAKSKLDLAIPFNLTCDADIVGGNSGSPLVNSAGEVVGLIFDGNIYSTMADVFFDPVTNRAIAVDSRGMLESFSKVYGADWLVRELTAR